MFPTLHCPLCRLLYFCFWKIPPIEEYVVDSVRDVFDSFVLTVLNEYRLSFVLDSQCLEDVVVEVEVDCVSEVDVSYVSVVVVVDAFVLIMMMVIDV